MYLSHWKCVTRNEPILLNVLLWQASKQAEQTSITPNKNVLNTYLFSETNLLHTMLNIWNFQVEHL